MKRVNYAVYRANQRISYMMRTNPALVIALSSLDTLCWVLLIVYLMK